MACQYCTNGCPKCIPGLVTYKSVNAALKNFSLTDPIAEECNDPKQLNSFFRRNEYIPYAGYRHDSQHTVLRFIDNLALLSPTLGGVINSIYYNCFGGKYDIKKVVDTDFDLGAETKNELSLNEKYSFLEWIKTFNLSGRDWSSLRASLYRSFKSNGNAWLEVRIYKAMGQNKVVFKFHPTRNCLYKIPSLFDERIVAVSKSWDVKYLKETPPDEIPVYPFFEKGKDGIRTMIHYKNGDNEFYGRPDWWPCSFDAFLEIKNKEYLLKAAHNNFTAKVLMEFADELGNSTMVDDEDAKKAGFLNAHERLAANWTDQGDSPTSLIVTTRPMGAAPAFVHEFNINTNHDYYKSLDGIATDKIIVTNGWSRKLMGLESATGLSTTAYIDELKTKMPLIENYQGIIDNNVINKAIRFVATQLDRSEFLETGLESKNPFDHLLNTNNEIKDLKQAQNKMNDGNNNE